VEQTSAISRLHLIETRRVDPAANREGIPVRPLTEYCKSSRAVVRESEAPIGLTWPSLATVIPAPATERNSTHISQSCVVEALAAIRANATVSRFIGTFGRAGRRPLRL
jgi:hypothetical protein